MFKPVSIDPDKRALLGLCASRDVDESSRIRNAVLRSTRERRPLYSLDGRNRFAGHRQVLGVEGHREEASVLLVDYVA